MTLARRRRGPTARTRAGAGLIAALGAAAAMILPWPGQGLGLAAAAGEVTFLVHPETRDVGAGDRFDVDVVVTTPVPITGAQANLVFDPSRVRVLDVRLGESFAGGILAFRNEVAGSQEDLPAITAAANETGELRNVAVFLPPGQVGVEAGEAALITVTLEAIAAGDPGLGVQQLDGSPLLVVDEAGGLLGPGASGGPPNESPSQSPLQAAGGNSVTPVPGAPGVAVGEEITVDLRLVSGDPPISVVADLAFDPTLLSVTGIEVGRDWPGATLLAGAPDQTIEQLVQEANTTGRLVQVGTFAGAGTAAPPDGVFATVRFTGIADGTSRLELSGATTLLADGSTVEATLVPAELAVGSGVAPVQVSYEVVVLAVIGIVLAGGLVLAYRARAKLAFRFRRWPLVASLLLALVPVLAFAGITVLLIVNSLPVLETPGLGELLGPEFASRFSGINLRLFGLVPALYGTIVIALIAMLIAVPVALSLAIIATEFPAGPLGRLVRPFVGVMAGIPPIVYAVSAIVFVSLFMIPKFAADSTFPLDPTRLGFSPDAWPPADVPYSPGSYPWNAAGIDNSTLLGGVLIALLLVPFLAPLLVDAIRNVPNAAREASLALGANRTYTLRRVILPGARTGMVAAAALASLKALGDTLIVIFAVGWEANRVPTPVVDVLERTPSLAAQGAGMLGGFQVAGGAAGCVQVECTVGYASALMLLVVAAVVVLLMTLFQTLAARREAR